MYIFDDGCMNDSYHGYYFVELILKSVLSLCRWRSGLWIRSCKF